MTGTDADGGEDGSTGVTDPETDGRSPAVPDAQGGHSGVPAVVDEVGETGSEAFQALGNEQRLAVLQRLLEGENDADPVTPFSALQDAADADSSAGFAYHLRQLTGRYVRKVGDGDDEGYVLTYAGRKVARAVAAGTYSESVDLAPVPLEDPCPHCGDPALVARCADNVVGIACGACERPVLSLPFPPRGYTERPPEDVPRAFDRYHRHRLALLRDGVCPECAGDVAATVERPVLDGDAPADATDPDRRVPGVPTGDDARSGPSDGGATRPADRLQAAFECATCGHGVRTPITLALLFHPAVVAFYRDHGVDLDDRPLWSVGPEWRESLLSEDPWAVVVSTRLDDQLLELYVDGSLRVVDHRRTAVED